MPTATPSTVTTTRCSFCAKQEHEIAKMVAGPGVFICDQCVSLCTEIISAETGAAPGGSGEGDTRAEVPYWESMNDEQLLAHLPRIAAVAAQVEDNLRVWVQRVRARGVSWARIGQSLDMTRQSAWGRFSGEE